MSPTKWYFFIYIGTMVIFLIVLKRTHPLRPITWHDTAGGCPRINNVEVTRPFECPLLFETYFLDMIVHKNDIYISKKTSYHFMDFYTCGEHGEGIFNTLFLWDCHAPLAMTHPIYSLLLMGLPRCARNDTFLLTVHCAHYL